MDKGGFAEFKNSYRLLPVFINLFAYINRKEEEQEISVILMKAV